jgi:ParB family chromosome partitioning protein
MLELIDIKLLKPSKNPVRMSLGALDDLMRSINSVGIIEPLVVRPIGREFEIIAGNRRYEACRRLRWKEVPCIVVEVSDKTAFEMALVENIQRGDLDPIEEAMAFKRYVESYGWGGISELAKKIGKSISYISHRIKLLDLPKPVLDLLRNGNLNPSQAKELIWVKDKDRSISIAKLACEMRLPSKVIRRMSKVEEEVPYPLGKDVNKKIKLYRKAITCLRICKIRLSEVFNNARHCPEIRNDVGSQIKVIDDSIDFLLKRMEELKKSCAS